MKTKAVYTLEKDVLQTLAGVVYSALYRAVQTRDLFHGPERKEHNQRIRGLINADRAITGYAIGKERVKVARLMRRGLSKSARRWLTRRKRELRQKGAVNTLLD